MKRQLIIVSILLIFGLISPIYAEDISETNIYTDLPLSTLYAFPDKNANVVLKVPMDVRVLSISADTNWYKVKISYDFGLLGKNSYVGWVYMPIGEVLEARKTGPLASTPTP